MLANFSSIDKVSIFALTKIIPGVKESSTIAELAKELNVSLSSELRNRQQLIERINQDTPSPSLKCLPEYAKTIVKELLEQSNAVSSNNQRASYTPWFKAVIGQIKHKHKVTYKELSDLVGISEETLMGFSANTPMKAEDIDPLAIKIARIWNNAPPKNKKTIDDFRYFLDKKHGHIEISYHKLRQILIDLGFYSPRGPKIKNHGSVKKPFDPHAIWEGDGKQINITINGKRHSFCWYAFTDQSTTLIVGSNVDKTETAENFLKALKDGDKNSGVYSIGVLIDNRLSDTDLSPINEFMKEHNIELIRTFPGNSKSNGIIENNFGIFERFVGDINISGKTSEQTAQSIAKTMVEIFTQLRNNQPRKRLHGATPNERAENSRRPEHQRSGVEKIANRLTQETSNIEEKWEVITNARKHFEYLSQEAENKIKRQLKYYTAKTLIDTQASYIAQIVKHPECTFTSAYFMAILRNKQETKAKQIYNEEYRAGIEKAAIIMPSLLKNEYECAQIILLEIIEAQNKGSPSQVLLHLESVAWALIKCCGPSSLTNLWQHVQDAASHSLSISLHFWQQANEYLSERLGNLLYFDSSPPLFPQQTVSEMPSFL